MSTRPFSALRAAAAKIRPCDMVAAVEQIRQRDEAARLDAGLHMNGPKKHFLAGPVGLIQPLGATHLGHLSQKQFQYEVAGDFRANIIVTFGHFPLRLSQQGEGK